jgi:hypothetical protein
VIKLVRDRDDKRWIALRKDGTPIETSRPPPQFAAA